MQNMRRMAIVLGAFLAACALGRGTAPSSEPPPVSAPPLALAFSCDAGGGGTAAEWNCTADLLNDEGMVEDAQRAYRSALQSLSTDSTQQAYSLGGLAVTSARLGDCEEAESAIRELRRVDPGNRLARLPEPVCGSLRALGGG
jgi:hypothetical protein